ncbi:NAD-glutamate dehydrogenase [Aureimonas fodinaquatilis]|uniref:NAD-glutamate dehydrogenase n=1 Tax=Aureimonas fodinaquatilis TaxID=2565783 RepID=A0A5B0DPD7_9HYPH|nr:NAD-glutamate dehydrogenase [Aureimonas fodinaquatilis]KAA0968263.1 NAD-glutamate dehydrogenase [Aureimonas fodinaquatilis]
MISKPAKATIIEDALQAVTNEGPATLLVPLLLARPPADDLAAFPPRALAIAAEQAGAALSSHRSGQPLVATERPEGFTLEGKPLLLVTLVNDDRPFLFDSVVAEVADSMSAIHYISHPILDVVRNIEGVIVDFSASAQSETASGTPGRVSLIQFALEMPVDPEAANRLKEQLTTILAQVRLVNQDFEAMLARTARAIDDLHKQAERVSDPEVHATVEEAAKLLQWLTDRNFSFFGTREFSYANGPDGELMGRVEGSELGILRDQSVRVLRKENTAVVTSPEMRAFLEADNPLIVAKANARSLVHRRVYMDYVGIKQYDDDGRLTGELRIVGLFTSSAYTRSILTIPYLRQKADRVIARFPFRPQSHSAKALLNILETYPRDELFQIDVDTLTEFVGTMMELDERPRVRLLPRIDPFQRFVSAIVFVPRQQYDSRLREEIGVLLSQAYDGHVSAYYPSFSDGPLTSVHFIIGRSGLPGAFPEADVAALEARIIELTRDWATEFESVVARTGRASDLISLVPGLPDGYRDVTSPEDAVLDAKRIVDLSETSPFAVDFYRQEEDPDSVLRLKLYALGDTLPLSTRVPILEQMGLLALSEKSFIIHRADGSVVHLHDMDLTRRGGEAIPLDDDGRALEELFQAVSDGRIESDAFNSLVLEARLSWREANVLRAYARYMRQTGLALSQEFIAGTLTRYPAIASSLFALFAASFDPDVSRIAETTDEDDALAKAAAARGVGQSFNELREALEKVDALDDDRVLRRYLTLILATLRTNYYSVALVSADPASRPGHVAPALAFKFDPHLIDGLPQPVPFAEIFVFDARVEGVHLRFGKVARGGLRWSDRSQDYRTEVLGLVKAQQVKNSVIVPVGAKGGFYPKRLPDPAARDEWFEAGRSAYVVFIESLLTITDTVEGDGSRTPENVVRHDEPDPYFVVAADKGTATFSDTANAIAQSRQFWLDDAFASGGSAGYDHKGMGITARGAWEAVKRHFREMNHDIQVEPFTVVGCGDMSGDVFGNGMLLSEQTRLIAAFDHRDIFIDPDPDTASSYAERQRLFNTPRTSWADYDKALISRGGGVFSRREKRITLSAEAAQAVGWDKQTGTPAEIINAILKAPVDLLWFGGIGTYVRAESEQNSEVGDKANDAVRVSGRDIRAKVLGEGANLGATQRGRIEYAARGGRVNTDAIDNSAGVNTSDIEVNIKIALKNAMAENRLTRDERNTLLSGMTADVAKLVLANNYQQTLALSLEHEAGVGRLPLQNRLMTRLEAEKRLDRTVEYLPSDREIADLKAARRGLTRPELAILIAYSKIDLFDQLVAGTLPDDPYLNERLMDYFPDAMQQSFSQDIEGHRLRREIVATTLANELVNRLGPCTLTATSESTGATASQIARAYVVAFDALGAKELYARIDALDGKIDGSLQNKLYGAMSLFLKVVTHWLTRNLTADTETSVAIAALSREHVSLRPRLLELASDRARDKYAERLKTLLADGVPEELADDIALLPLVALIPDAARVSRETSQPADTVLAAYFAMTRLLKIGRLETAILTLNPHDYFETLALARAGSQISDARRVLTANALTRFAGSAEPVSEWEAVESEKVSRIADRIVELAGGGETSVARLTLAAGLLSDLAA